MATIPTGYYDTYMAIDLLRLYSESPCRKPTVDMLVKRKKLGVDVIIINYLYAVNYMLKLSLAALVLKLPSI